MIGDRFPAIGDYGFLSDRETAALLAPDGAIEWLCPFRFDGPSVFGALLDRGAGRFRFGPVGTGAPVDRRYLPGTNVLETSWAAGGGWADTRDALVFTPGTMTAARAIVRTVRCSEGELDFEVDCEPRFGYGLRAATWTATGSGVWEARGEAGDPMLQLWTSVDCEVDARALRGSARLREGDRMHVALAWDPSAPPIRDTDEAFALLEETGDRWRRWLTEGSFPDHPLRSRLQRSALALKGMIYAPRGSMVAAPTTSLPETPGGERNWDYRFTWVRDATFALWGLHVLGFHDEAHEFMRFIASVCDESGPETQIMFGIDGERRLTERELPHLSGYRDARPVRTGNAAFSQRQNDVYGALLDAIYIHSSVHEELPDELWRIALRQAEGAAEIWQQPDQGIWEARGEPRHYCSSKLMCWVAFDRTARLATRRGDHEQADRFGRLAARCRDELLDRGVRGGILRQHYDTDALDASLLMVPLVRFLPPDDDRVRATVNAIAEDLTENGLVLRYRVEETDDGLRGEEGTFTICSFWLVSALSETGEADRARTLCDRLLGHAGALGLYAEELGAVSGTHLGNFPQAFTHLALINAVSHVIADERREREAPPARLREMRASGSAPAGTRPRSGC